MAAAVVLAVQEDGEQPAQPRHARRSICVRPYAAPRLPFSPPPHHTHRTCSHCTLYSGRAAWPPALPLMLPPMLPPCTSPEPARRAGSSVVPVPKVSPCCFSYRLRNQHWMPTLAGRQARCLRWLPKHAHATARTRAAPGPARAHYRRPAHVSFKDTAPGAATSDPCTPCMYDPSPCGAHHHHPRTWLARVVPRR